MTLPILSLTQNAADLLHTGIDHNQIDRVLLHCNSCQLVFNWADQVEREVNNNECPNCSSGDLSTDIDIDKKQKLLIVTHFHQIGLLPSLKLSNDGLPYLTAFTNYITSTYPENKNQKLLALVTFVGEIATELQKSNLDSDVQIDELVAKAALKINFDHRETILAVQSCLCDWIRTPADQSICYRIGNLLTAIGAIAETLNNPDISS